MRDATNRAASHASARRREIERKRGSGRERQKEIVMRDGCLWSMIALHSLNLDHSESSFPFAFEQPICAGLLTIRWLWRIHPLHEIFVVIDGGWLETAHRGECRFYRGRIVASIGKFVFVFFFFSGISWFIGWNWTLCASDWLKVSDPWPSG